LIAVVIRDANVSIDIAGRGPKYLPAPLEHHAGPAAGQGAVRLQLSRPGAVQCSDEGDMEGFKPGIIEKRLFRNATRFLNLEDAVVVAACAAAGPSREREAGDA